MKTLEQLGVSPAPWKTADDGMGYKDILCNGPVTEDREGENIIAEAVNAKDANIMAAAPKLYKALLKALPWLADIGEEVVGIESAACIDEIVKEATAALAEAAGESEVAK